MSLRSLSILASGLCAAASALAQGPPPAPVRIAPAVMEDVAERRMVTGQLRALHIADVASEEAGVVVEMLVEIGERVEAGQLLARLDDTRLTLERQRTAAERAAAESAIAEEQASLQRWQLEVDSLLAAAEVGASNVRERRDAETALEQARARLEKAGRDVEVFDARLDLLDQRLEDMRITAPFAGAVTRKLTERGQWVSEGDSVAQIVATDSLEAVLDVPQRYLTTLAERSLTGEDLLVRFDDRSEPIALENVRIVPQIDERSRTFRLVGQVRNPGVLAPGLSVVGWVPSGASGQHLVVPTDAVIRSDMGVFLYVARQTGEGPAQAVPANVTVLFEMPGRVVIESGGVREGDSVIVEGNERLYPMAPVAPLPSAEAETTAERAGPRAGEG